MTRPAGAEIIRRNRSICIPFNRDEYPQLVKDSQGFRNILDETAQRHVNLFPNGFQDGYEMKDLRYSKRLNIWIRRIRMGDVAYTIRPSFVMPYMTGMVDDVESALFLRKFNVPFWALAHCYGTDPMYWYRMECALGRYSIVGATVVLPVPPLPLATLISMMFTFPVQRSWSCSIPGPWMSRKVLVPAGCS